MLDLKPEQKDRLFKQIDSVDCGRYDMEVSEATTIADRRNGFPLECIRDAFRYGFIKGQRAEQARQKKRKPARLQDMKVGDLSALEILTLHRIHGKERETEAVFHFARGLTNGTPPPALEQ